MCGCESKVSHAQSMIYPSLRLNDEQNKSIQALNAESYKLRQQANHLDVVQECCRSFYMNEEILTKNQKSLIADVLSKLT